MGAQAPGGCGDEEGLPGLSSPIEVRARQPLPWVGPKPRGLVKGRLVKAVLNMVTGGWVGPQCMVAQDTHPTGDGMGVALGLETWMELSPQLYEPSVNLF